MATTFELANSEDVIRRLSRDKAASVNFIEGRKTRNNSKPEYKSILSYYSEKCNCCGEANHMTADCPYELHKCNFCDKQGHLMSACKLNKSSENNVNKKRIY